MEPPKNKKLGNIADTYIDTTCLEGTELKIYELKQKYSKEKKSRIIN